MRISALPRAGFGIQDTFWSLEVEGTAGTGYYRLAAVDAANRQV